MNTISDMTYLMHIMIMMYIFIIDYIVNAIYINQGKIMECTVFMYMELMFNFCGSIKLFYD